MSEQGEGWITCSSCTGSGLLPEWAQGVALFGGGVFCLRCEGRGRMTFEEDKRAQAKDREVSSD